MYKEMSILHINYNDWFYVFHHYLTGNRDGLVTYNDTKWANAYEQLKQLIDTNSILLSEQPAVVVGNHYGFDHLMDLMAKSSYTWNDVNQSLLDTYQHSLQNAMSRMVVNTHAIIYHNDNMSKVYSEGKYFLLETAVKCIPILAHTTIRELPVL